MSAALALGVKRTRAIGPAADETGACDATPYSWPRSCSITPVITPACSTTAGTDQIVIYGSSEPSVIELVASSIAPQVREIRDAS